MLFLTFNSQDERRKYCTSSLVEIQFCKLPVGTKPKDLVSVSKIKNWQDESLYVNDENEFFKEYSEIFNCGMYNNLKSGTVDIYGINYYPPSSIDVIIEKLRKKQTLDSEVLIEWLNIAKKYNGFYILGI